MKSFSHAGVSRLNGQIKVRFANDALRTKVLVKSGHKDIDLIELRNPMAKLDAVKYLISIDFATRDGVTNNEVKAALDAELAKRDGEAAKPAPTMEGIKIKIAAKKAKTSELETETN